MPALTQGMVATSGANEQQIDSVEMTPTQPLGARARLALRLVGLFAVVAGVIGMHGLANHGVTGMEAMGHPMVAIDSTSEGAEYADVTADAFLTAAATIAPAMPAGMDINMAGWCIAILMMAFGGLILLLRMERGFAAWVVQLRSGTALTVGRDPDPPSLRRLSIQRC